MGFVAHDVEPAQTELAVAGLRFLGGPQLELPPTGKYTRRLYLAIDRFLQQGGCPGVTLERAVGHLVNHPRLMPWGLSALDHCYRFLQRYGRRDWGWFSESLATELRVLKGLVKLVDVDLAAPRAPVVFSGDSSTFGYSLSFTRASPSDILEADRLRERWRFKTAEISLAEAPGDGDRAASHAPHLAAAPGALGLDIAGVAEQSGPPRSAPSSWPRRRRAPCRVVEASDSFHALDDTWARPERWRNIVKGDWAYHNAIHLKEARVALTQLRRAARCPAVHGKRLLGLTDNLSALLAFMEGRASDFWLRLLARQAAALAIGAEIAWHLRNIEGSRNCADHDSRAADRGEVLLLSPLLGAGGAAGGPPQRPGFW
ncbi:unnamed protein product, partial [Prorocentrum cordatum]